MLLGFVSVRFATYVVYVSVCVVAATAASTQPSKLQPRLLFQDFNAYSLLL